MSEEVLIPKMTRIDKTKRKVKIPLLNFAVVIFGTLLIIASTFVDIGIKHYIIPANLFSNNNLGLEDFIFSFYLIPQVPVIMFVCAVLGKRMSLTLSLIHI